MLVFPRIYPAISIKAKKWSSVAHDPRVKQDGGKGDGKPTKVNQAGMDDPVLVPPWLGFA